MAKKIVKVIFISLAIIAIGAGVAITLLVTTINQDTIKNRVTQIVYKKTGRDLKITGDVSWTLFPWIGIKIQNISLSNPSGFADVYFAKAEELNMSIKLMPLILERSIEIKHFILKDLDLHLITNKQDKNNWQDLLVLGNSSKQSQPTNNSPNLTKFIAGNITIIGGNILWHKEKVNKKININKLNLSCKNLNFNHPFTVKTSFDISQLHPAVNGAIEAKTQISLETANIYKLKNLKLRLPNAMITGSLQITKTTNMPDFTGDLTISDTGPQALIKLLSIKPQKQINSSFKVRAKLSPKTVQLPNIKIVLNDMVLKGDVNCINKNLRFDIFLNKLDPSIFNTDSIKAKKTAEPRSNTKLDLLSAINTNGTLKIGAGQFNNLHFTNFFTKIVGGNGLFNCQKLNFDFYESKAKGNATIDTRNPILQTNLSLSAANIVIQELLKDLAKYDKFSGNLTINTNLNMHGITSQEMCHSLSGAGNIVITDGSYHGVDVPYEVRRAHAILNSKPMPKKPEQPYTNFDRLTMSFNMSNALLNTNDFLVQASDYKVTGKGGADLIAKHLNLALSAYSMHDKNFFLPVKVTGAFTKPTVKFDAAVMLKQEVKKVVEKVIQNKVGENLSKELKKILPF